MEAEEEGAEAVSCGGEGELLGLSPYGKKGLANEASNKPIYTTTRGASWQNHNVRTGPY
jgi:hypothetical protein